MDVQDWTQRLGLYSSIAEIGILLTGRDGVLPTRAVGSGIFVAPRLIMTVKLVARSTLSVHWAGIRVGNGPARRERGSMMETQ